MTLRLASCTQQEPISEKVAKLNLKTILII